MPANQSRNNSKTTRKRTNTSTKSKQPVKQVEDSKVKREIILVCMLVIALLVFLSNFGVIGAVGNQISKFMFGCIGFIAYLCPVVLVVAGAFYISNRNNKLALRKMMAGIVLYCVIGILAAMIAEPMRELVNSTIPFGDKLATFYGNSSTNKNGGGILFSAIAYGMIHGVGTVGTVVILLLVIAICCIFLTQKSLIKGIKKGSRRAYDSAKVEASRQKERMQVRREEQRVRAEEEKLLLNEEPEPKKLRMEKKFAGVMFNTKIATPQEEEVLEEGAIQYDMHEYVPTQVTQGTQVTQWSQEELIPSDEVYTEAIPEVMPESRQVIEEQTFAQQEEVPIVTQPVIPMEQPKPTPIQQKAPLPEAHLPKETKRQRAMNQTLQGHYEFPPIQLLKASEQESNQDATKLLRETANQLEQTLATFGVKVTVTDISQGPSVTRFELQPESGVKVSKIVGLADDIKLNLAATDIRIEAPIPGKAAVGIEVPNKENSLVALRDLFETNEFKTFDSNLAFAVGKDIAGKVVVSDIAKMPHMLVAGATGSGKSVCINTLIMSILYKAHPDDVKLIMIDPKVVELSVYNGIPHLLIPVVTDPKKAAAALHWGVAEMTDRYKKFADYNVRDLKGYNAKVAGTIDESTGEPFKKMPQIIIIVDELADLMMVAPGEVEESICRLAQLARAAGIHLIIATQRPSVDVITGLIKANMPSRVAFSVSSGVDSRTILDMNGAEKLLGKGDMLFYPQGYSKPGRVQGAFVSDGEVSDVVDFLKNQSIGNVYSEDITSKIEEGTVASSGVMSGAGEDESDIYFNDAARFIIEKEKASIGMLQRVFKIGFNRAARIMDQLAMEGIVGEEEGTKPRKVLMTLDEFEQYISRKEE